MNQSPLPLAPQHRGGETPPPGPRESRASARWAGGAQKAAGFGLVVVS